MNFCLTLTHPVSLSYKERDFEPNLYYKEYRTYRIRSFVEEKFRNSQPLSFGPTARRERGRGEAYREKTTALFFRHHQFKPLPVHVEDRNSGIVFEVTAKA